MDSAHSSPSMHSQELTHAIVLLSGGIDSAACAHFLLSQGVKVSSVFLDYGQASAEAETGAAQEIAKRLGIKIIKYVISGSSRFPTGELTGRNAFLACTTFFLTNGAPGLLAMGIHAGTPYYDCSDDFVMKLKILIGEQSDGRVSFIAPFLHWTKKEVFDYFISSGLPIQFTYSCEAGTRPPCGKCASCQDRRALGC